MPSTHYEPVDDDLRMVDRLARIEEALKTVARLEGKIDDGFANLRLKGDERSKEISDLRQDLAVYQVVAVADKKHIDEVDGRLKTVECLNLTDVVAQVKEIMKVMPYVRVLAYLTAGLAVPMILISANFVWDLITHAAQIVKP